MSAPAHVHMSGSDAEICKAALNCIRFYPWKFSRPFENKTGEGKLLIAQVCSHQLIMIIKSFASSFQLKILQRW